MKPFQFSAILILILFNFTKPLAANPVDQVIPIVAFWEKGDYHYYEITKTNTSINNGIANLNGEISYLASFMVVESDDFGYTIQWQIEGLKNEGQTFTSSKEGENILTRFIGINIIYRTSPTGEIIEFLNRKEVEEKLEDSFSDFHKQTASEFFNTQKPLPVFDEIKLLHSLFGRQYQANKVIEFKEIRRNKNRMKFELDGIFLPKNINNGESLGLFTNVLTLNKTKLITNYGAIENYKNDNINLSELNFQEKEERLINYDKGLILSIYKETKTTVSTKQSATATLSIELIQ
ncbi:hypothetical protein [Flexithrix dorotheae]|uniref:hypothetical protein n=1 Tax=Flexithrix dorotheae TaxID=70993 RepID=UPI000368CDC1|nr:hypothetical protein [Flexithrix dorotheae]